VLRSCFMSLAVIVCVGLAARSIAAGAAEPAGAPACARADLAIMYKLGDERDPSAVASVRLAQAGLRVLDARAACRTGNYASGIDLYAEAAALAGEPSQILEQDRF
jgi:hypothetical protein